MSLCPRSMEQGASNSPSIFPAWKEFVLLWGMEGTGPGERGWGGLDTKKLGLYFLSNKNAVCGKYPPSKMKAPRPVLEL